MDEYIATNTYLLSRVKHIQRGIGSNGKDIILRFINLPESAPLLLL